MFEKEDISLSFSCYSHLQKDKVVNLEVKKKSSLPI